ncbi:MAG: carbon-nitrogen hydrolase family protein [candidate division FCPU426 bacterium]
MREKLKVALGQVHLVMGDKATNKKNLLKAVEAAGRLGCDLIVLPECPLSGWLSPKAKTQAESIPGPYTRSLSRLAKRYRMAVVSGIEERQGEQIYNSAVMIGRDGALLATHRKINELDIGLKLYSRGTHLGVFDFEGRKVALNICADSWGAEICDTLSLMGAELIFSPCAWAIPAGGEEKNIAWISSTYFKRCKDRKLSIVAVNSVGTLDAGPWKGRLLQGDSLVVQGPRGKVIAQGARNQAELKVLSF